MSRLAMLYALEDSEVEKLRFMPMEERYTYMLNEIEEKLIDTPRGCELNKAWEAIQYCLGGGKWNDENKIPTNIIFGGEFLVDEDDDVITLKTRSDIEEIVAYLHQNNLQELIKKNFWNIDDENFQYKDDNDELDFALGWSEDILAFYENALKENYQVIFTVDF
ncbi:MAG: YfbM family protein [Lachnospiraceae bacterium]|nr:YfbM family protein [Lachnospiraceae bacterium]